MNKLTEHLKKITYSSNKDFVIASYQDNFSQYEEIIKSFKTDNISVYEVNDSLELRVLFETKLKRQKQKGLIFAKNDFKILPDILSIAKYIKIGFKDLLPNFDRKVLLDLPYSTISVLYNIKQYDILSYNDSIKFVLEHIYGINAESIFKNKTKEKILKLIICVFFVNISINKPILQYIESLVKPFFPELVKNGLNRDNIIAFLRKEWEKYVYDSSSAIDFDSNIIAQDLGKLFTFDFLRPLKIDQKRYDTITPFLRIGVFVDQEQNINNKLENLIEYLRSQTHIIEDLHNQWFNLIRIAVKAKLLSLKTNNAKLKEIYHNAESQLNDRFQDFIENSYFSLFSLSGVKNPVLVSRIMDYLKYRTDEKKALLVIDGMNFWQWQLILEDLEKENLSFDTKATMAFIPTITAWSRQSIFKGKRPDLEFDNSKEKNLFFDYWTRIGMQKHQISFKKIGINNNYNTSEPALNCKILGLVCNDLDDLLHGSILGDIQLMNSTLQWTKQVKLSEIIQALKTSGFKLFITSDHGNIESCGMRNLKMNEKAAIVSRGKRHLKFAHENLLRAFINHNSKMKLGVKDLSVYLKNYESFNQENVVSITHGGSHFWEVIVPFIEVL